MSLKRVLRERLVWIDSLVGNCGAYFCAELLQNGKLKLLLE
jgi:hypothetical protein